MYGKKFLQINWILVFFLIFIILSCKRIYSTDEMQEENIGKYQDVMKLGRKLNAPTPLPEKYFDDLIHPCVRFIPEGFAGHQWWMVGTPYRGGNNQIENPILYYGDSREGGLPPLNWTAWGVVSETPLPLGAYNSDPNLFWDGKGLWVFWRESYSSHCAANKMIRSIFGIYSTDGISFSKKKFFAGEPSDKEDSEMCPTVIEVDGKIRLYGVKHQFIAPRAPWGLTIWEIENNDLENHPFVKTKDVQPTYKKGFDLWHTDFFKYNGLVYCVATPEAANEVLFGVSRDGEHFTFWDKPLISTENTGKTYLYKASAMVHDGVFYLWTPVAELGISPRTSRIWMSEIKFDFLLQELNTNLKSSFN